MTKVYLIRHAEAEGNVFRRLQGQYDSCVTPNGLRQIEALARRFEKLEIDAVYASDLTRTVQTAEGICRSHALPLHRDARLREICCGCWEDQPFGSLERDDPARNHAFSHQPEQWQVEGSEPYAAYTGRFLAALDELVRRHDGQTICVVSHGMVMRGALQCLFFPGESAVGHSENTAVTALHWDGAYHLDFLNDASHITPELSTLGRQQWWRGGNSRDFNMWFRDAVPTDAALLETLEMPQDRPIRVAGLGEHPVGALCVERGVLYRLALLSQHRGIGLSAQLLGEAVSRSRREGETSLRLGAPVTHPAAARLLERYGFRNGERALCAGV